MYEIVYKNYTWCVVEKYSGKGIVCFPSQVLASEWIRNNTKEEIC